MKRGWACLFHVATVKHDNKADFLQVPGNCSSLLVVHICKLAILASNPNASHSCLRGSTSAGNNHEASGAIRGSFSFQLGFTLRILISAHPGLVIHGPTFLGLLQIGT